MGRQKKADGRLFWVKFNLDDCRAATSDLESFEEKGRFFAGFMVGAGGFEMKDQWCLIQKRGFIIGQQFLDEACEVSGKQRVRVNSRYSNTGPTVELPEGYRGATLELPTNSHQPTTNKDKESSPSAAASSAPPPQDKKRLPGKKKYDLEYPKQVEEMAQRIKDQWPRTHVDGSSLNFNWALMVSRLNSILETNKNVPVEMIEEGVRLYLNPPKPPMKWKAPQFYFGPGDKGTEEVPSWLVYARMAFAINKEKATANV